MDKKTVIKTFLTGSRDDIEKIPNRPLKFVMWIVVFFSFVAAAYVGFQINLWEYLV